jgi:hypothetical protein
MTGWTEERRKKQAAAIRIWKPWEKSIGPRTPEGKARCKMNALRTPFLRGAERLLHLNREFVKQYVKLQFLEFYDK